LEEFETFEIFSLWQKLQFVQCRIN
jgi:hypothetical protein